MSAKAVKHPGPDHPIALERSPQRVRITWRDQVLADTARALTMREAAYPPVFYVPRANVAMALLERSAKTSYCPYKGDASYFTLADAADRDLDAVWSYEAPYDAVALIKDHLAFYPDRVRIETL